MADDPQFWKAVYNTLYYTLLAVPIGVVVAMVIALAMNQKMREIGFYRAGFYLPSILPVFAISFIFIVMLNPGYGLVNYVLSAVGLQGPNWLGDPAYTKLALVMIAQLGAGQYALIFLAGLKGIPAELYESASLDGAGAIRKFFSITLPLMTPVILFDIVIGLSLALQIFTSGVHPHRWGRTGCRSRQLAADVRVLPLPAGLPVRPDGLCGRAFGRAVHRQPPPRLGRLQVGGWLGLLRIGASVDGDGRRDGTDRHHRSRVAAARPSSADPTGSCRGSSCSSALIAFMAPFYWMFISAVKTPQEGARSRRP